MADRLEKVITVALLAALGLTVVKYCDLRGSGLWLLFGFCGAVIIGAAVDVFRK